MGLQAGHGRILVIEDDPDIQDALARILEAEGYGVATVPNGVAALEVLRARKPDPCLIILDLMMPVMDGWQFRAEQLRDPRLARIPVVVLSAHGAIEEHAEALRADRYLKKPIDLDLLLAAVRRYCC